MTTSSAPHMQLDDPIYVAGHRGLVGSAVVRGLEHAGYTNLVTRTRSELDLCDAKATAAFFAESKPKFVVLAAARVGGIVANNTYPADFIRDNLLIQNSIIDASYHSGVERLLFLGSSCIYPKFAAQPIAESSLLTGPLEATNRPYALAKIAGVEMCWSYNRQFGTRFLAAMPTNLYGPNDNFDRTNSHVLPALIRKAAEALATNAPEVVLWGSGTPRRELMYSDDLAAACVFLLNLDEPTYVSLTVPDDPPLINVGTGEDISIRELAETIFRIVGYHGGLTLDASKPDGTPRKLLDSSRLHALGWRHGTSLDAGISKVWEAVRDRDWTV